MLVLQRVPYVNRIVIAAAKDEPAAQGQAARCETGVRVGRFEGGQLLIGSEVPQSRRLVLGRRYKTLPGGVVLGRERRVRRSRKRDANGEKDIGRARNESPREIGEMVEAYADGVYISVVTEERLLGFLFPQVPQFAGLVDRAGDVSVAVGRQADAHHVARVRLEVRRFLIGLEIPYATGREQNSGCSPSIAH